MWSAAVVNRHACIDLVLECLAGIKDIQKGVFPNLDKWYNEKSICYIINNQQLYDYNVDIFMHIRCFKAHHSWQTGGERTDLRPNGYPGISPRIYPLSSPWWAVYEQCGNSVFRITKSLGNCICCVSLENHCNGSLNPTLNSCCKPIREAAGKPCCIKTYLLPIVRAVHQGQMLQKGVWKDI